jgi:hypothetical protein
MWDCSEYPALADTDPIERLWICRGRDGEQWAPAQYVEVMRALAQQLADDLRPLEP